MANTNNYGISSPDAMFASLQIQNSRASVATSALSAGLNQMQKKDYKQAVSSFRLATAMQPDYVEAYNYLARASESAGDSKGAIKAYGNSLKLDRTQDSIQVELANIYITQKDYANAEKALKAAIQANSGNVVARYTLGQVYVQEGKLTEAHAEFKKVTTLSPKDGNGYYALGMALNKLGKSDEAIRPLETAISLKRDFTPAMFELGKAYKALGKIDKVQEQIDRLSKINTADAQASVVELKAAIKQPKFSYADKVHSTFKSLLSLNTMDALDPSMLSSYASKSFTMIIAFDSDMDAKSVTNPTNWQISKASGGKAGLYDNGLYRATDVPVPFMPNQVIYDPEARLATVVFNLSQNSTGTGTIDPSHVVFKFLGKDVNGNKMDPSADQYDGAIGKPF